MKIVTSPQPKAFSSRGQKGLSVMSNYVEAEKRYNAIEFLKFVEVENSKPGNENTRYELIDGQIYMMSAPSSNHMELSRFLYNIIYEHMKGSACDVYYAAYDVFLVSRLPGSKTKKIDKNRCGDVVQPDLFILCDKDKLKADGVHGAPDLVIEIVSKSSIRLDYADKLTAYINLGVKEYWVVDPLKKKILIYQVTKDKKINDLLLYHYIFSDTVESKIFPSLFVDFSRFIFIEE